ncbi:class I SAM-dependent methyltransferase [Pontibacillus halophilus]|nr:class I SAM-dependent methyltransferase [Pontibacillus halophilus]
MNRPFTEEYIDWTEVLPSFRVDLRNYTDKERNKFVKMDRIKDWSSVTWKDVGRPYEVKTYAKERVQYEAEHEKEMDPHTAWTYFNRSFHEWFVKHVPDELNDKKKAFAKSISSFNYNEIKAALTDVVQIQLWNYVHRIEDGIWDPRGKRALFEGLDVGHNPKILFLGAAEGYEALQLGAMYPGGQITMVDYDEYCKTTRFGTFPSTYPFLGENPNTGQKKVYYKDDLHVEYIVDDIRNLSFGREFDIVLSVGMLEHFPDAYKPEVVDWHRRFTKPGGYAILTTPRNQFKSRLYYRVMADVMNHTYRELMTLEQMGLFLYENGMDIVRSGYIKVHNAIVAKVR